MKYNSRLEFQLLKTQSYGKLRVMCAQSKCNTYSKWIKTGLMYVLSIYLQKLAVKMHTNTQ